MNKRQAKKRSNKLNGKRSNKLSGSSYVRKTLLKTEVTEKGNTIYSIPASKVRDKEFKKMVRKANDRLRSLEKAGLYEESREYRLVSHYAYSDPGGKGSIYNVNPEKDTIRFSSKLPTGQGYTKEREYMVNTLRNFLNAQTSTVTGTKKAINKAYNTFMENNGARSDMSQEEYTQLWKIYHDMGLRDKLDNQGYNAFMTLITQTDLYRLNKEDIESAMSYLEKSEKISDTGKIWDVMENLEMENNIKLAW